MGRIEGSERKGGGGVKMRRKETIVGELGLWKEESLKEKARRKAERKAGDAPDPSEETESIEGVDGEETSTDAITLDS